MKIRSNITDITRSIDGDYTIICTVPKDAVKMLYQYKDQDINLTVKKYSEQKSQQANAYAWYLLTEIAKELSQDEYIDKWEVYKNELVQHSTLYDFFIVKPEAIPRLEQTYRVVEVLNKGELGGQEAYQVQCYYGSSYFTKEDMRPFLNGIVEDAKALGIPTENPAEIERLVKEYQPSELAKKIRGGA